MWFGISNFKYKLNPLSVNPTNWSNTLKQFAGILSTNCLSVFDHFVGLAPKGLIFKMSMGKKNISWTLLNI